MFLGDNIEVKQLSININALNTSIDPSADIIDIEEISASDLPDDLKKAGCVIAPNRLNPCGIGG